MNPPTENRFVDKGALLGGLVSRGQKIYCICPKCEGTAVASCESDYAYPIWAKNPRVHCLKCSFELRRAKWLGPVTGIAYGRCSNCGFKGLRRTIRRRSLTSTTETRTTIPCPACAEATSLSIRWTFQRLGSAIDPVFGLPLLLRESCCGETLWAFHGDHLSKLKSYIAATLRERVTMKHWSLFQRLPQWMTAAKNRRAVLQTIGRLESKLASVTK